MAVRDDDLRRMDAWLEYLRRAAERKVKQGDARAIKTALGIARRQMKLRRNRGGKAMSNREVEGFPITIFNDAIQEIERQNSEVEAESMESHKPGTR
jgi:hypothetical protein